MIDVAKKDQSFIYAKDTTSVHHQFIYIYTHTFLGPQNFFEPLIVLDPTHEKE